MTTFVRGYNPIWSEVDLTGNQFDDTFYLFTLQNTIPYLPATVYRSPTGATATTDPIQFLANGTLPNDIYFNPEVTYRLEFRQGNTMADPLIYLVENYQPGQGSVTPIAVSLPTDNQITNPQFADISFQSGYRLTGASTQEIQVAPGWVLELTGSSASVTLQRLAKTSSLTDSTNAPYALRLTLSDWSSAILRQRFEQNGILWAGKTVSTAVTARGEGETTPEISARLVDSNGTNLGQLLTPITINGNFESYTGKVVIPTSTNTNTPPAAYIDYELVLPGNCDIYLTSFQVIASSDTTTTPSYEQTTVNRQIDHTFNIFRDSLLYQAKGDILTGWDFALNPWQARSTTIANLSNNAYTADQTVVIQQAYVASTTPNNVAVGRATFAKNYGLTVQANTATNQFGILQFIDPADCRSLWGKRISSYVRLDASTTVRVKAKLAYRSSLPATIGQNTPIATWVATAGSVIGEPDFAAGWTEVTAENDPIYTLTNGINELYFDKFTLPASDNDNMTLAIIVYTLDPMNDAAPDSITFNKVNLIQNDFATDSVSLTFSQTLQACRRFYQKSFTSGQVPAQNGGFANASFAGQTAMAGAPAQSAIPVRFPVQMRATPTITLYNPAAANALIRNFGATVDCPNSGTLFVGVNGFATVADMPGSTNPGNGLYVHWAANARLGN